MKILYTNFHDHNGGGHVTYVINLLKTLGERHDCSVATPGTGRLFQAARGLPQVHCHPARFTSRIVPMVGEVQKLRELLLRERYDLVHVNGSADHRHIMLACMGLRNRPSIVFTKHNDHPVRSLGNRLRASLATDASIAVSDYVAAMMRDSPYGRVPLHVIRHGVDTHHFAPVGEQEKGLLRARLLGDGLEGMLVLGSSGGTDLEKGWLDLAGALALLAPGERARVRVMVAGDPPGTALQAALRELGVSAHFVFPGLLDDVRPWLAACDAGFVLSHREALSFACRETLALGLPTLVTDAGGLPENISPGEDGWIVPVHDRPAIAAVLRQLLKEPACLQAMGRAARAKAEREFNLGTFARHTEEVYAAVRARVE